MKVCKLLHFINLLLILLLLVTPLSQTIHNGVISRACCTLGRFLEQFELNTDELK